MKAMNRLGKLIGAGAVLVTLATAGSGCLSRPVGQQPPTTKVNFATTVSQQAVDKVDLLFMIDNSASMGDKQTILADAVPDLIGGLLEPNCITLDTQQPTGQKADPNGSKENQFGCPAGSEPEFAPVTDMHIGIVSSSLGSFGGDICPNEGRYNDRAHLLAAGPQGDVPKAKPSNFLAWFPANKANEDPKRHPPPANATTSIRGSADSLEESFKNLVVGVGQSGCGLEAQLESMYRFLIQPDPWVQISLDSETNQADLGSVKDGQVDVELLQQRADFLRPDSLVAIVMLTDEDDSSADPLAVGGQGWAFMARSFPGSKVFRGDPRNGTTAPRGTTACTDPAKGPGHADCTSCGFQSLCNSSDPACQRIKDDPNCKELGSPPRAGDGNEGYAGYYGPTDDNLNVRFHRMKERYGIDPQYPYTRYVDGLTKFAVPDREAEHPSKCVDGKTPPCPGVRREIGPYTNTPKCRNPLFARNLPRAPGEELCRLTPSTRSPDLIFFAIVGGVPNQLLHFTPGDPEASRVTEADWTKILGQRPQDYNYSGIDPHMIQSVAARPGLPPASATRGDNGTDPIHGREWDTLQDDLQYACTFNLPETRNCTAQDPSCDCAIDVKNPPLCGQATGAQLKAKAYPTVREFMVARALGDQGIAASLCPITLDPAKKSSGDVTYGYRPAVAAIIDRLKNALTTQCLPQKLTRDESTNAVPCLVIAQLAEPTDQCSNFGLKTLQDYDKAVYDVFIEQQKQESGTVAEGGLDLTKLPVCVVDQQVVQAGDDCRQLNEIKWCYVENGNGKQPAGRCPQALLFASGTAALQGARFSLQCIQQFSVTEQEQK
jgi:hypothetical protein